MRKGVRPIQAEPSKVSTVSPAGSIGCTTAGGYRQCRKAIQFHRWYITGQDTRGGGGAFITGPVPASGDIYAAAMAGRGPAGRPGDARGFISVSRTLLAYDEALRLVRDDTERRHLHRLRNGCVEEDRTGYGNEA
jgi:hypothetical protein